MGRLALTIGILLAAILWLACTGQGGITKPSPAPPTGEITKPSPSPQTSDIQFVLDDTYSIGETIEVKIKNVGRVPYGFNPDYEACYLSYSDSSGREFIIPPGTHCDLVSRQEIKPNELKTLFEWNLDECIKDQWGCAESKPLPAGTYTIRGEFRSNGSKTVAEKSIRIVE